MKIRRRVILWILIAATVIGLLMLGFFLYTGKQMEKIPGMTAEQCLQDTLSGKADGRITVALLKDGEFTYHMYGENGKEIPLEPMQYEIGSLTKTMTAALVQKAVQEGKLSLDETIDTYLGYETGNHYPTLRSLLTHTSGCKGYYFAKPFIRNFFTGGNSFLGVTKEIVREQGSKLHFDQEVHPWNYSNFGFALLGLILEEVNGQPMEEQLSMLLSELDMKNSYVSLGESKVPGGWTWNPGDAYVPAGAVVSDIQDMAGYASRQLKAASPFQECHKKQLQVDASPKQSQVMDIHADAMGLSWVLDEKNGFIWHNGGTSNYNSYLGFCPETETAVVVLSNMKPNERISATVIGIKLLQELQ